MLPETYTVAMSIVKQYGVQSHLKKVRETIVDGGSTPSTEPGHGPSMFVSVAFS